MPNTVTMKFFRTLMMLASLSVVLSAGNVVLTTDPLTGLPIDPKSDLGMNLGNAPLKMDDQQICKSKMQANLYSVFDKVDPTVAWYAAHLTGFHKSHTYFRNRTQNAFYNDAGTLVVIVVGDSARTERTSVPMPSRITAFNLDFRRRLSCPLGRRQPSASNL